MQRSGSGSWRFAHDVDQVTHALLFLRDSLRLAIEPARGIPPHLEGDVPDRSDVLGQSDRWEVTKEWPGWWSSLVSVEARHNLGVVRTGRALTLSSLKDELTSVVDPPEWSSLADRPKLRCAAQQLVAEGCRWANARLPSLRPPRNRTLFEWRMTRDVAEAVAREHDTSVGALNGCALILLVDEVWWETLSPGVALCSASAAADPVASESILREVFGSYLAG